MERTGKELDVIDLASTSYAPRPPGQPERVRALAAHLLQRDGWSRDELLEHQRTALRSLLRHAVERSPYYRETLGPDALAPDVSLGDLPTLTKETMVAEFDRVATDPRLRLAELEAHLDGPAPGALFEDDYAVFATPGTTGQRGVVAYRKQELELWMAAAARATQRVGVTPTSRLVGIGAPSPLHLTNRLFAGLQAGQRDAPRLTVVSPISEMVAALNEYRPDVILTYPSIAAQLADEQLDGRLEIAPRTVSVGAEVLTDDMRRRVREAWAIETDVVYGATEAATIAASLPGQRGLAIAEDLLLVEVVDEDGRPVPPGVPGARVLVTNLVNRAQPLIRYELSDAVTLAEAGADGAPYRLIERVEGRREDALRLPGPAGSEVVVQSYHAHAVFSHLPEVRRYQLVRVPGGLHVRVVLAPSAPPGSAGRVRNTLARALRLAGAARAHVTVEPVSEIHRDRRHAAKLRLVA